MHRPTLLVVGLLLAATPAFAQTSEEVEKKVLEEVNAYRVKKGVAKLEVDDKLNAIAQEHARGMAEADKYGDDGKDGHVWKGKDPAQRVKAAGYKHLGFGENVGWNVSKKEPAEVMVKTWLGSAPHEKNIVSKEFTRTGIGAAKSKSGKWYFVHLIVKPVVLTTTVTVMIENRTKQKITFRIGKKNYDLEADRIGEVTHSTSAAKVQIGITWPGSKKEELFDLVDKGSYAFVEKDKDKYAFEKAESK